MLLIGADGGGTHTKLVLADESGCVLASSEGGAVNYNAIGLAAARANLFDAAESIFFKASFGLYVPCITPNIASYIAS